MYEYTELSKQAKERAFELYRNGIEQWYIIEGMETPDERELKKGFVSWAINYKIEFMGNGDYFRL